MLTYLTYIFTGILSISSIRLLVSFIIINRHNLIR